NVAAATQAVLPSGVLLTIFNMMAVAQETLKMILAIVGVIVLIYVFVVMYSATLERQREIATMRALGAHRATVLAIVLVESGTLAAAGGIGGILAGHAAAYLAAAMLAASSGLVSQPFQLDAVQPAVLAIVILLGMLAGLLPAVLAYRTEVAENLAPLS
ncbi:MAG TPA: FtsX-like permease family protein, partial [Stellaceae bacterium]|nr:FtsX-like permease family protein [Stellaceae bacterium]